MCARWMRSHRFVQCKSQEVKHIIFEEDRKVNMISVIYEETIWDARKVSWRGKPTCETCKNDQLSQRKQWGPQDWVKRMWVTAPIMLQDASWIPSKTLRMIWEMAPSCFCLWIHDWVYHTLASLALTKTLIFALKKPCCGNPSLCLSLGNDHTEPANLDLEFETLPFAASPIRGCYFSPKAPLKIFTWQRGGQDN